MKQFINIALMTLILLISKMAFAQFEIDQLSFGGAIGKIGYSQNNGSSLGLNLRINYALEEDESIVLQYNTQLPVQQEYFTTAYAKDIWTNPSSTPVTVTQKVSYSNVAVDYHLYFIEDIEERVGIYGLSGLGLTIAKRTLTTTDFDRSLYQLDLGSSKETESFTDLVLNLGIGSNVNVNDRISIFAEGKIGIPLGIEYDIHDESAFAYPISFNYAIMLGARFNFYDYY